jgi:integrase
MFPLSSTMQIVTWTLRLWASASAAADIVLTAAKLIHLRLGRSAAEIAKTHTNRMGSSFIMRIMISRLRSSLSAPVPGRGLPLRHGTVFCRAAVEFPVIVKGMFRPHHVTSTEQAKIEKHAPAYLRNVVRIITENGLRVYKELACMKKDQVDLANKVVFIADSKTPTGVSEVPLTDIAVEAFRNQMELSGPGPWLFPSSRKAGEPQADFKKTWERTLQRAKIPHFRLYDLRSTYATRLSAGGVADE